MMSGQSWKKPDAGRLMQSLDPPPQFGIPEDPMREAPIIRMTVPVTMGGKIRCRVRGETKDMNISRKEQMSDVPSEVVWWRSEAAGVASGERTYRAPFRTRRGRHRV